MQSQQIWCDVWNWVAPCRNQCVYLILWGFYLFIFLMHAYECVFVAQPWAKICPPCPHHRRKSRSFGHKRFKRIVSRHYLVVLSSIDNLKCRNQGFCLCLHRLLRDDMVTADSLGVGLVSIIWRRNCRAGGLIGFVTSVGHVTSALLDSPPKTCSALCGPQS